MASAARRTLKDGTIVYRAKWQGFDGRWHEDSAYDTRRDAQKAATRAEMASEQGVGVAAREAKMTFAVFVNSRYWPSCQHLSPTTRGAYRSYLHRHFLPAFGALPLRKINTAIVQKWVNGAVDGGLSARSIGKYRTMLASIFSMAVDDGRMTKNPCQGVRLPRVVKREKRAMSATEVDALMSAMPEQYRLLVQVEFEAGLRWSEAVALRPCDVDWETDELIIQRSIVEVSKKISPTDDRMVIRDGPKEGEWRRVQLERETLSLVREHMMARGLRDDDLLFATSRKTPLSRNTFRTRVWQPARIRAGLSADVTPHLLRHTHISWLLAGGADLVTVMRRAGHRQLSTTQGYLHGMPDAGQRALDTIATTRQWQNQQKNDRRTAQPQRS